MSLLPQAFLDEIRIQLGDDVNLFLAALQKNPPTSIRLNTKKEGRHQALDIKIPWASDGYYLKERPVFTLDPFFHAGHYYVQEASSMFLEYAIKRSANLSLPLRVLDLCAAPGGKSTHLLSLINSSSLLISNEVIRSRSNILSENIQKWGSPNVMVTNNDPADFKNIEGYFDIIVIDAPCSGEGLFRKDPDSVKEWSRENVALCSSRQKRILHDVWPALKENGILIYCTCTYNSSENEDNLLDFSKTKKVDFIDLSPDKAWHVTPITKENLIGYRFFPHQVEGEGFFLSAMRKREPQQTSSRKTRKKINDASSKITGQLVKWVREPEEYAYYMHNDLAFALPIPIHDEVAYLLQYLHLVYVGTNLATIKHDKLIPEHSLALSSIINLQNFEILSLDTEEAIRYLRREALTPIQASKGFHLVTHESAQLGWANVLPNRINNMYPQEWRIRMAPL